MPPSFNGAPSGVPVTEAIRRHWRVVVVCLIAGLVLGAALGLLRTPRYEAEARLDAGRIDLSAPGALSGFKEASQTLASDYSRAVSAEAVTRAVGRKLNIPPLFVESQVTATPIPESSVFVIEAAAPNSQLAVRMANESALALQRYVLQLNRSSSDSGKIFKRLKSALATRAARQAELSRELSRPDATADRRRRNEIKTAEQLASIRVDSLRQAYRFSVEGQDAAGLVQIQSRAITASSDRLQRLQIFLFVGLVAGGLIGCGIAIFRANATVRAALGARHGA